MADPVSIGMIALTVGSKLFGAAIEASTLRANANVDEQNAQLAEVDGARQAEAVRRQERATTAEGRAAMGANGVAVDTGSALDYITQNAVEREYDILNVRYQADTQAKGLLDQAKQKRKAAKNTLIGGFLNAGASALSGFGNLSQPRVSQSMNTLPGMTMPVPGSSSGFVAYNGGPRVRHGNY